MNWQQIQERLHGAASPWLIGAAGLSILAGLHSGNRWLDRHIQSNKRHLEDFLRQEEVLSQTLDHYRTLRDLKAHDVAQFKGGFGSLALSNKTLFEAGLSLQEERRLLEKQYEIMITYLAVDPALQRIFLMRGEQPLESYRVNSAPPRLYPEPTALILSSTGQTIEVPTAAPPIPTVVRIVSKERFAHPERGHSEQVNGKLQYNPPQVGTSVRSNALGEFVVFTNSRLILHGPPLNEEDHRKFPHLCLGLDLDTARKLYHSTFIGTKILLRRPENPASTLGRGPKKINPQPS